MPASRADLLARLAELNIATTTVDHPPVFTVEEARRHCAGIPGVHCKNLFLKDAGDRLWLVVAPDHRRIDLKTLPARIGAKRLSFVRPELLREVLGVDPGSVTPFALMNDTSNRAGVVLDAWMMRQPLLNYHPLVNTATTSITNAGLLAFITAGGHEPRLIALE